jgi:hypothetical protein
MFKSILHFTKRKQPENRPLESAATPQELKPEFLTHPITWDDIPGWFQWPSAQHEAAQHFGDGGRFVEVGNYLGRSLCSLAEITQGSGKRFQLIGVDTCRGNGVEGPRGKDYHGAAVAEGGGTFAGLLHRNILACGFGEAVSLIIADSNTAATFFPDQSIDWVHLLDADTRILGEFSPLTRFPPGLGCARIRDDTRATAARLSRCPHLAVDAGTFSGKGRLTT